jgi:hypothetical protein
LLPGLLVALGTGLLAGELTGLLMGLLMGLLAVLGTANGNPAAAGTGWGAMT